MKTVIVSAFYNIPSKQPYAFYREHLIRWFRSIHETVVFFTTSDIWQDVCSMGVDVSQVICQFLPMESWTAWTRHGREFWERQKARDPESYHTPELAAIWYEKKEFVQRAFSLVQGDVDVWVWCDAGCIRDPLSELCAHSFTKRTIGQCADDRLHIQRVQHMNPKPFYQYPDCQYAAAILIGNRTAWIAYDRLYEEVLMEYDAQGVCGNSDQYILARAHDRMPSLFTVHDPPAYSIMNPWFFFLSVI